jgi:succinylarginine dihydrolase
VVEAYWPEQIAPDDLLSPQLWAQARAAHAALEAVIAA